MESYPSFLLLTPSIYLSHKPHPSFLFYGPHPSVSCQLLSLKPILSVPPMEPYHSFLHWTPILLSLLLTALICPSHRPHPSVPPMDSHHSVTPIYPHHSVPPMDHHSFLSHGSISLFPPSDPLPSVFRMKTCSLFLLLPPLPLFPYGPLSSFFTVD